METKVIWRMEHGRREWVQLEFNQRPDKNVGEEDFYYIQVEDGPLQEGCGMVVPKEALAQLRDALNEMNLD